VTALGTVRRLPAVALLAAAGTLAPTVAVAAGPTPAPAVASVVGGARLAAPGVVVDLPPGVPRPPAVKAASYVVADLSSGNVLVAKAAHRRLLPASALKSLTALTLLPRLRPETQVRAEPGDLVEGSKVGIAPGSTYTVQQLMQGMMLSSGNDAATALARAAGGVPQTVARMQTEALALGARDTVVRNPSGLDAAGQVTSAYDLALVARAGMRLPAFRQLVATRRAQFPGKQLPGKHRAGYEIQNHNRLLANYEGAIGVKNGYTVAARWSVVGAASRGGRTYVVTALRRGDGSWRPTAALLDWAFTYGGQARPVGRLVNRGEALAAPAAPASPASPSSTAARTPQATPTTAAAPAEQAAAPAPTEPAARQPGTAARVARGVVVAALGLAAVVGILALLNARARRPQSRGARRAGSGRRPRR
jgi:D-alanyl-D-alanine carboxypeptidase (penicillin-binding protein 5/6)